MLKLGPQLKRWGRTDAVGLYLSEHFGSQKEQKLLGWALLLIKVGMASGLATEMLFSSQFPVVGVGLFGW